MNPLTHKRDTWPRAKFERYATKYGLLPGVLVQVVRETGTPIASAARQLAQGGAR